MGHEGGTDLQPGVNSTRQWSKTRTTLREKGQNCFVQVDASVPIINKTGMSLSALASAANQRLCNYMLACFPSMPLRNAVRLATLICCPTGWQRCTAFQQEILLLQKPSAILCIRRAVHAVHLCYCAVLSRKCASIVHIAQQAAPAGQLLQLPQATPHTLP